jgi:hypothetical protein
MKPVAGITEWPALAVYDIEAENWVDVVLVGHVDEFGNRVTFKSIAEYTEWLFTKFQGDHVWAHWGGHYDHRFIIHHATLNGWEWETVQSGNMIIIVTITHLGKTIKFCESARLMPDSVAKIGKTVGLPKLDVDRSHIEKLTYQEVVEYCLRDCDIVLLGLQSMKKAFKGVGADFAYTLASIATRWVRRSPALKWYRFYDYDRTTKQKVYSKQMLLSDEFAEPAYFGGRVEVFKQGTFTGPLYYYDIRSSYPWSMLHDLPAYFTGFAIPNENIDKALARCGISEATVTVPRDTYLPVLCVRYKGKLIFPTGTFRGRWTNIELVEAKKQGVSIDIIHAQALFTPKPFLRSFVTTFYGLRQEAIDKGDSFKSYTYKICLNSIYGKTVESVERTSVVYGHDTVEKALEEYGTDQNKEEYIKPTNTPGVYIICSVSDGPFRHVSAGAYITARSRLKLLEGMRIALANGGQIYYCDTDSIVTDVELPMFSDELGNFKLEETFSEATFISPKVYKATTIKGEKIFKVKGIPVKALDPKESEQRFDDYVSGIAVPKDGISSFIQDINKGTTAPRAFTLERALRKMDSKRIHENGNSLPLDWDVLYAEIEAEKEMVKRVKRTKSEMRKIEVI